MRRWIPCCVAAFALIACGGEADPTPPTCQAGEVALSGTVDGVSVTQRLTPESSAFGNAIEGEEGVYEASLADGSGGHVTVVKVNFKDLVLNGKSVDAHGSVDLTTLAGPNVGNCETSFVSTLSMDADGNGGTFVLRDLHDSPYCSGASHAGALAGCFKFSN